MTQTNLDKIFFTICLVLLSVPQYILSDILDNEENTKVKTVNKKQLKKINKKQLKKINKKQLKKIRKTKQTTQSKPTPKINKKTTRKKARKKNLTVRWKSKGMKANKLDGKIELIKNVFISQDTFRLKSNTATVFFSTESNKVKKVLAKGRVEINDIDSSTNEKLKAFANTVIFNNKLRVVTLIGKARLWRGSDQVVRGDKITYELDSGWIKADKVSGELNNLNKGDK